MRRIVTATITILMLLAGALWPLRSSATDSFTMWLQNNTTDSLTFRYTDEQTTYLCAGKGSIGGPSSVQLCTFRLDCGIVCTVVKQPFNVRTNHHQLLELLVDDPMFGEPYLQGCSLCSIDKTASSQYMVTMPYPGDFFSTSN